MNEKEARTAGVLEAAAHLLEATTALIKAIGYEIGPEQYQLPFVEDYETVRQPQAPQEGTAQEPVKENKKKTTTRKAKPVKEEPVLSLVDVRAQLTEIARGGKQQEVKDLISSFGAERLTDVDPASYRDLLAKAKEL